MGEYAADTQVLVRFMEGKRAPSARSINYRVEPLTLNILKVASVITDVPELHDKLIAATAAYLNIPLLTNDPDLIASQSISTV